MNDVITKFALNTESDTANFDIARFYHGIGQTASAISCYLRCAERTDCDDLAYVCLLQASSCFYSQNNRNFTTIHLIKQAIALLPKRPEAYFFLCRHYERIKEFYECYVTASIAIQVCDFSLPTLPSLEEFPGKYALIFYKGLAAWHWDKTQETRRLFVQLIDEYRDEMRQDYLDVVQNNLMNIGVGPVSIAFNKYTKDKFERLKVKFEGSENIENNYSQLYQDMFVLTALNGKKDGTYLEIGSGDPFHGNNTALLETRFGWTGVSIDIDEKHVNAFKQARKNIVLCKNALTQNYKKLLDTNYNSNIVDYLQVDCEPAKHTFEILLSIPFNDYKFRVITFEHDYTVDVTRSYREKSRNYLTSIGYKLVVNDVGPTDWYTTEDWWVHPDLIDTNLLEKLQTDLTKYHKAEDYFLI